MGGGGGGRGPNRFFSIWDKSVICPEFGIFVEERGRTIIIGNSSMDGMRFHFSSLAMWIITPKSILCIWLKNST